MPKLFGSTNLPYTVTTYIVKGTEGSYKSQFSTSYHSTLLPLSYRALTLYDAGGGSHEPPLGIISHHSVGDAPTNPKFLDFSQFDPYFHLVKSFFIFFVTSTKKMPSKIFFNLKKNDFLTKMVKNIVFSQILAFFVSIM